MSEYWVSTKKYWCKHCQTFIKDTPLSHQQHDATPKHQNALKRFLRDLHRGKERDALATENAKREADRLNNLDNPNYTPAPLLKRLPGPGASSTSKPRTNNGPLTEEQRRRNLDELAALGVAMPESYAKENAMVGEWETVRVVDEQEMVDDEDYVEDDDGLPNAEEGLDNDGVKREEEEDTKSRILQTGGKRKLESSVDDSGAIRGGHPLEADDDEEAEARRFKVRTKEYPVDGEVDGLDDLFGKGKMEWKGRKKTKPNAIGGGPSSTTKAETTTFDADHAIRREVVEEPNTKSDDDADEGLMKGVKAESIPEIKREEKNEREEEKSAQTAEADAFGFKKRKVRNKGRGALA